MNSVAYSPDGQALAVSDQNGAIYLWNTSADTLIATHHGDSFAWAPEGNILATGDDGNTYLWNTTTETLIATLPKGMGEPKAFAPYGNTLATDNGNYIYLWHLTS